MIGVEMLYKLLECIGKTSKQCDKTRIIERLHCMLHNQDCGNQLIEQINQAARLLNNRYHWFQLVIWNNFFHAIFSVW